jgi:hypothetical protein
MFRAAHVPRASPLGTKPSPQPRDLNGRTPDAILDLRGVGQTCTEPAGDAKIGYDKQQRTTTTAIWT